MSGTESRPFGEAVAISVAASITATVSAVTSGPAEPLPSSEAVGRATGEDELAWVEVRPHVGGAVSGDPRVNGADLEAAGHLLRGAETAAALLVGALYWPARPLPAVAKPWCAGSSPIPGSARYVTTNRLCDRAIIESAARNNDVNRSLPSGRRTGRPLRPVRRSCRRRVICQVRGLFLIVTQVRVPPPGRFIVGNFLRIEHQTCDPCFPDVACGIDDVAFVRRVSTGPGRIEDGGDDPNGRLYRTGNPRCRRAGLRSCRGASCLLSRWVPSCTPGTSRASSGS